MSDDWEYVSFADSSEAEKERRRKLAAVVAGRVLMHRILRKLTQLFALAEPVPDDWSRAAGDCICPACRREYREHATDVRDSWLTILCGGTWVKL